MYVVLCGRACLHLCALVLEPKLDLQWLEAELPAELLSLLVIRVWALLEEPDQS
jgi:hypothetical protein